MSLFAKVFTGPEDAHEAAQVAVVWGPHGTAFTREANYDHTAMQTSFVEDVEAAPSQFTDYVKSMLLTGKPPEVEASERTEEDFDEDLDDPFEDSYHEDDDAWLDDDASIIEESPAPELALPPTPRGSTLVQINSSSQKNSPQVEKIVDGLFDRMKGLWGDQPPAPRIEDKSPPQKVRSEARRPEQQRYALAESKHEITNTIRAELPRAMRGELTALLRKEILSSMRNEITRVIREEFAAMTRTLVKTQDQLHAMDARLARIQGSTEKEVQVNFPKGAIKIDAPVTVTVPEREVKIASPINVQPPSVTFDEGAINVVFKKESSGKKKVQFDRDPFDNCVKSAEIIDVPPE